MNIVAEPYLDSIARARLLLATDDCAILDRATWTWVKPEDWIVSGTGAPWSKGIKVAPEDRFSDEMLRRVALWLDGLSTTIELVFARTFDDHLIIDCGKTEESAIIAEAQAVLTQGFVFQV